MPITSSQLRKTLQDSRNPQVALGEAIIEARRMAKEIVEREVEIIRAELNSEFSAKLNDALAKLDTKPTETLIKSVSMLKGEKGDSPTAEDLLNLIKPLIPTPKDGKNPLTVSKSEPQNPVIGDLWFQP